MDGGGDEDERPARGARKDVALEGGEGAGVVGGADEGGRHVEDDDVALGGRRGRRGGVLVLEGGAGLGERGGVGVAEAGDGAVGRPAAVRAAEARPGAEPLGGGVDEGAAVGAAGRQGRGGDRGIAGTPATGTRGTSRAAKGRTTKAAGKGSPGDLGK